MNPAVDPAHANQVSSVATEADESVPVVELQHVTFVYDEGVPVLQDVSLTIAADEQVTLAGRTGAGKSCCGV